MFIIMAITPDTLAHILFKKSAGKGSTDNNREFFEEPFNGKSAIFKDQIWTESNLIPLTAPTLASNGILGVVQYKVDILLTLVPGTERSFQSNDLKDIIPFNFDNIGSYNYSIKDSSNVSIPFGLGDWLVDGDTGTLTFYGDVPSNMPPTISFYKYIGTKGDFTGGFNVGSSILTIVDKELTPSTTAGNNENTGLVISLTPPENSVVEVKINGLSYVVGNNTILGQCYFEDPNVSGIPRSYSGSNKIVAGDKLIWNGIISEFDLENDDTVSLYYSE